MLFIPRHVSLIKILRYNFSQLGLTLMSLQCDIWKIMGKAWKKVFMDLSSCKIAIGRWSLVKIAVFQTYVDYFFLAKLNFLKDSFNATLNLLNIIEFWHTFGLFHYAKLPSYKRVSWGRLARPSHIKSEFGTMIVIKDTYTTLFPKTFFFLFSLGN